MTPDEIGTTSAIILIPLVWGAAIYRTWVLPALAKPTTHH